MLTTAYTGILVGPPASSLNTHVTFAFEIVGYYLTPPFPPLQGALSQLIQYYHRFQKVLSQSPFKSLAIRGELINIHHLMVEVKRHRATF